MNPIFTKVKPIVVATADGADEAVAVIGCGTGAVAIGAGAGGAGIERSVVVNVISKMSALDVLVVELLDGIGGGGGIPEVKMRSNDLKRLLYSHLISTTIHVLCECIQVLPVNVGIGGGGGTPGRTC